MPRLFIVKKSWIYAASAVAIILVLLFVPSSFSGIRNAAIGVLLSPAKGLGEIGGYFASKKALIHKNSALNRQIESLTLETARLKEVRVENERLRTLLGFKNTAGFDTVPAQVIARNPNDWVGSLIIDRGSDDGLYKNSAVCAAEGLLGKILEPGKKTSPVMLLTHPGFKTGGILEDSRLNGIVIGLGRGRAKMMYIPVDAEVKEGSLVITSGYSKIFPKGIPIGRVVSVERSKTGLYKYAIIKPLADPLKQEEVLCVKQKQE